MRSYHDSRSPLSSAYFRMGMFDGYKLRAQRPDTDSLFATSANSELAYSQYCDGYSAGLDSARMPTYEVRQDWGSRGGENRALLNVIKPR